MLQSDSTAKRFLVSGGSGGIGAAVCDLLAQRGYVPIVGFQKNATEAEAVAKRTGGTAVHLDLTSPDCIRDACESIASDETPLAGVVLAGSPPPELGPFGKISSTDMNLQWQVNVAGPQLMLSELVRNCFRKHKQGVVVGVLTKAMGTEIGNAASGMGAYVIAKYGQAGLLAALAADYTWLRVRSVKPGYTETRMLSSFDERFLAMQREREAFQTPIQVAHEIVREATES